MSNMYFLTQFWKMFQTWSFFFRHLKAHKFVQEFFFFFIIHLNFDDWLSPNFHRFVTLCIRLDPLVFNNDQMCPVTLKMWYNSVVLLKKIKGTLYSMHTDSNMHRKCWYLITVDGERGVLKSISLFKSLFVIVWFFFFQPCKGKCELKDMKFFCTESERSRQCWLATMRLVNYGALLRENYNSAMHRTAKSKVLDSDNAIKV